VVVEQSTGFEFNNSRASVGIEWGRILCAETERCCDILDVVNKGRKQWEEIDSIDTSSDSGRFRRDGEVQTRMLMTSLLSLESLERVC